MILCEPACLHAALCWVLLFASIFSCCNFLDHSRRTISVHRWSHSRPEQVPRSKRERMLQRPTDTFMGRTGMKKQDRDLCFGNWVLDSNSHADARNGRNPKFGYWRARWKKSRTPNKLLKCLYDTIRKAEVDTSVLSCAMQTCGYNRWWETLLEVHDAQEHCNITSSAIQARIF